MPVLSIITINYNNKKGLEDTIVSVTGQTIKHFEFIIIDGGSTDGGKEVIDNYKNSVTYSVSEKDNGVYDAQNKGIKAAKGDYLLFLNSGDTFYNTRVIEEFYKFIDSEKPAIAYGDSNLVCPDKKDEILRQPEKLDLHYFFRRTLNHQATFIKRELFFGYGLYDLNYRICADFDFFFKVFVNQPQYFKHFNCVVCNYMNDGISSSSKNYDQMVSEKQTILKKNLSKEEYNRFYKGYRQEIPLKYRILERVYKVPILNWLFKKVYLTVKRPG